MAKAFKVERVVHRKIVAIHRHTLPEYRSKPPTYFLTCLDSLITSKNYINIDRHDCYLRRQYVSLSNILASGALNPSEYELFDSELEITSQAFLLAPLILLCSRSVKNLKEAMKRNANKRLQQTIVMKCRKE